MPPMHLIVAFARAFAGPAPLALPALSGLLARLAPAPASGGDETSLSPPHERAWAEAIGLAGDDGAWPLAALAAADDGVDVGGAAVGLLTPSHWRVGRDGVLLANPEDLQLDAAASRALFETLRGQFDSEGFALRWGAPLRWYALHDDLDGLRCASLDRVVGRAIDRWLPPDPRARRLRRLQSEVQMLLHDHPVNDTRESLGLDAVNSFWLSGCGRVQPVRGDAVVLDTTLRSPALHGDAAAWQAAWQALDAGPIAALAARAAQGGPVTLTLCGERAAQRFDSAPRGWWQRLAAPRRVDPQPVLEAL